jgi:hypothetical protein
MAEINEVQMEGGALGKDARYTQPTHGLRWMAGRLQQAWLVTQCGEVNQKLESSVQWRDVPDETQPVTNGDRK